MMQLYGWHNIPTNKSAAEQIIKSTFTKGTKSYSFSTVASKTNNDIISAISSDSSPCFSNKRYHAVLQGKPCWASSDLSHYALRHGQSNTLVEAYRRYGIKFLHFLKGQFSFALLDLDDNKLLLGIDRIGIHSMFYKAHNSGNDIIFANSINTIKTHPAFTSIPDPQAIYDYLYSHMVPSPRSIYIDNKKLLPGQYLEFSNGKIKTDFYWVPDFTDNENKSLGALSSELKEQLRETIKRYDLSDKTGAFLSGGIDSSTVVGLLSETRNASVEAFSIGFDAKGFDEIGFARATANHYHATLHEYYVSPQDVVNLIPRIAAEYDEPFGNSSAIPTYYCARLAKEAGITMMLAGDGGDELFAGNARYAQQIIFELYSKLPRVMRSCFLEPVINNFPGRDMILPVRKAYSYIEQAKIALPHRLESYNFMERISLEDMLHSDFLSSIDINEPRNLMSEAFNRTHSDSIINKMLYLDWKITLADNDLRKVNRMCQLADMDVAYPLLDDSIVEFSTKVPPSYKLRGTKLRYFFKESMRDFLPPHTMNKSKHGFGLPFGVWLKTSPPLQEIAYDSLIAIKKRNIIQANFIDKLIDSHRTGHASFYGDMIWILMMLELWLTAHQH